jgi:hypothetical protein|tara:strand:- start:459 stop:656 length:198 start_codon:yes stop_codon:yes gene_type:complete
MEFSLAVEGLASGSALGLKNGRLFLRRSGKKRGYFCFLSGFFVWNRYFLPVFSFKTRIAEADDGV